MPAEQEAMLLLEMVEGLKWSHREITSGASGSGIQDFAQGVHILASRADGDHNCHTRNIL